MVAHALVTIELEFGDMGIGGGWAYIAHIAEALGTGDLGITHHARFAYFAGTPDDVNGQRVHEVGAVGAFEYAEDHAAGDVVARHPPYPGDDVSRA